MRTKVLAAVLAAVVVLALVAGCGGSSPAATPGAGRTITGTITYHGTISAMHRIVIVAIRQGETTPAYVAVLEKPGRYTFSGVTDGSYTIVAFMDIGEDMGQPQPDEPQGFYDLNGDGTPEALVMTGGAALAGADVTLTGP